MERTIIEENNYEVIEVVSDTDRLSLVRKFRKGKETYHRRVIILNHRQVQALVSVAKEWLDNY